MIPNLTRSTTTPHRTKIRPVAAIAALALLLIGGPLATTASGSIVQPRQAHAILSPDAAAAPAGPVQTYSADADFSMPTVTVNTFTIVNPPKPKPKKPAVLYKKTEVPVTASIAIEQAYAQAQASAVYGWGADQFTCIVNLWNKESGWNMYAENTSSGAYGIPQALPGSKMVSMGDDWKTNYKTQIDWGLWYFANASYGTPCNAWAQSQKLGWY